jgi:hypothetical protein
MADISETKRDTKKSYGMFFHFGYVFHVHPVETYNSDTHQQVNFGVRLRFILGLVAMIRYKFIIIMDVTFF